MSDNDHDSAPLTVTEAAAWLKVSPSTVYALCQAGELDHFRVGLGRGSIRTNKKALLDYTQKGIRKLDRPHLTLHDLRQAL
jgi:excisionase family DNA binding protein